MEPAIDHKDGTASENENPGSPVSQSAQSAVLESIDEKLNAILSALGVRYESEGRE